MSVGGGSFFKGWSSMQRPMSGGSTGAASQDVLIGQVLDVNYDDDIGKIRVRLLGLSKEVNDDDIDVEAYPSDLNQLKYPLPGEIVLIVNGIRNLFANSKVLRVYYYITTLSSNQSITFNSDPFIGQSVSTKDASEVFTPEYTHRFERKLRSLDSFVENASSTNISSEGVIIREKSPLKPFEGDMILQGRFGSTIRLGSTSANRNDNQWSDKGGAPGNPITILSANRSKGRALVVEDVNRNDSTVYIATSQTIPVEMFTSSQLRTHMYKYDITNTAGDFISTVNDLTSFVESPEEEVAYFSAGIPTDLSVFPDIPANASLQDILNSIPDELLDEIPPSSKGPFITNNKSSLKLILVDSQPIEKTAGKALLALKKVAASEGVNILLGSGYRPQFGPNFNGKSSKGVSVVFTTQETLRRDKSRWKSAERQKYNSDNDFIFKANSSAYSPQTAPPGKSKHGDGIAADVNTGSRVSFSGILTNVNYVWMVKNSWRFGFVRTVSTEEWHFEYQPAMSRKGPYGGIPQALSSKSKRDSLLFYKDLGLDSL